MIMDDQPRWYLPVYGAYCVTWSLYTWGQPLAALVVLVLLPVALIWPMLLHCLVPLAQLPRTPVLREQFVSVLALALAHPVVMGLMVRLGDGLLGVTVLLVGAALWHTHPLLAPLALALVPARAAVAAHLLNEGRTA